MNNLRYFFKLNLVSKVLCRHVCTVRAINDKINFKQKKRNLQKPIIKVHNFDEMKM